MATSAVTPAASAPAEPTPNFEPSTYTAEEHAAWMEKGTVPQSKPAESTPAKDPAGASTEAKPVAESATVPQQEHKGKGADARKEELHAEIQELLRKRAELRAEVEGKGKPDAKPAESSTAKPEPKVEKPKKPQFGEVADETWEQFEARMDAYHEALTDYKVKEALAEERKANEKARLEAETAAANKAVEDSWKERVAEAEAKHADFAEVAFSKDTPITPAMDGFILDSPVGPLILYALGQNGSAEGKRIAALGPYAAVRELVKIEMSLSDVGTAGSAKPAKSAPVAPITRAAKPATDLRATQGAPVDERKAAIEAGDVQRYFEIENARDVERRKRG